MFTLVKLTVFLAAAISVAAMPSHLARQGHNHREIAARVAQPDVAPLPEMSPRNVPALGKRLRKRAGTGRCSSSSSPSPSPSPVPSPSIAGDVKNDPQPTSTPTQDPATTPSPDPTPTPNIQTPVDTPTPTPSPSPSPTSGSGGNSGNSGGGQTYTGQGTFYSTGLGACGITNNDGQDIAAVSHLFFDSFPGYDGVNPNANPMCGKIAQVTFQGKTITVALTDRCEACAYGDLDFSPHAFDQLSDPSAGRISGIQWTIIN